MHYVLIAGSCVLCVSIGVFVGPAVRQVLAEAITDIKKQAATDVANANAAMDRVKANSLADVAKAKADAMALVMDVQNKSNAIVAAAKDEADAKVAASNAELNSAKNTLLTYVQTNQAPAPKPAA